MSREALSLEISQVVSRVVKGEPIDPSEKGAALAAKYPDLGMSAELIGAAITRAASMVGRAREEPLAKPKPQKPAATAAQPPRATTSERVRANPGAPTSRAPANGGAHGKANGTAKPITEKDSLPVSGSIDEALANAIDAEIGALITGQTAQGKRQPNQSGGPPSNSGPGAGDTGKKPRWAFFRN